MRSLVVLPIIPAISEVVYRFPIRVFSRILSPTLGLGPTGFLTGTASWTPSLWISPVFVYSIMLDQKNGPTHSRPEGGDGDSRWESIGSNTIHHIQSMLFDFDPSSW